MTALKILGIAGSLREASANRRALFALSQIAPEDVEVSLASLADIPLYNADLDEPPGVVQLKREIAAADGLLIATPEYNYGIPGVLKNAIDWVSRPAYQSVLAHKPIAMFGVAPSPIGTARAQAQLKQVLLGTVSELFPTPEVALGSSSQLFDEAGQLADERSAERLRRLIVDYSAWLRRRVS